MVCPPLLFLVCDSDKSVVPGEKHLHPSLDLISLLHLDTLYDTFVRPYADAEEDELGSGEKVGKGKKRRLEKGYAGLIEDCIG
jgi:hypothetical protein